MQTPVILRHTSAGEYRGGYWAEAYTVRDAEKYKNSDVVNIQENPSSIEKDTPVCRLYLL